MRHWIDITTQLLEGTLAEWQQVDAYLDKRRIPNFLQGLAAEARKTSSCEEFEKDYILQIKHGIYWHWTDDPHFQIDLNKGPRDMSSMAGGRMTPGELMITSHLEYWEHYGHRPYVVLIDMSEVPRNAYYQVKRGFGNEFMVRDPSKAKVLRVIDPKTAKRLDRRWHQYLPQNFEQLRRFYELANK